MSSEKPRTLNDDQQLTTESDNEPQEIKSDNNVQKKVGEEEVDTDGGRKENEKSFVSDGHEKDIESDDENREEKYYDSSADVKDDHPFQKTRKGGVSTKKKLSTARLSDRLEYLSRPKKDILDRFVERRLDGAIPETTFPSCQTASLQTKIALGDCPIPVTSGKMGTNLFLSTPGDDFDFGDENNLLLPSKYYNVMHDPCLKSHLRSGNTYKILKEKKFISDSDRAVCTLDDVNTYRRYQRRILAAGAQKTLRDEDEAFRRERARGMEEKMKRDAELHHAKRTQGVLRKGIKDAASKNDRSLEKQIIRDMKVLNCQIRRQKVQQERVAALEERYQRLYENHMNYKYGDNEKAKRKMQLAHAKADLERSERLCKRQEETKMMKKEKLDEFWKQKCDWQKEWLAEGKELDRKREVEKKKNIEILNRRGKLPHFFLKENKGDVTSATGKKSQKSEILDTKKPSKQASHTSSKESTLDDEVGKYTIEPAHAFKKESSAESVDPSKVLSDAKKKEGEVTKSDEKENEDISVMPDTSPKSSEETSDDENYTNNFLDETDTPVGNLKDSLLKSSEELSGYESDLEEMAESGGSKVADPSDKTLKDSLSKSSEIIAEGKTDDKGTSESDEKDDNKEP